MFLKEHGIRTRIKKKISEGNEEILESMRKGYVNYVISTRDVDAIDQETDGTKIRRWQSPSLVQQYERCIGRNCQQKNRVRSRRR